MYNIRTNILLDEKTYNTLKALALKKGVSMGSIIRNALQKVYMKDRISKRMLIKDKIEKYRVIREGKIDYKKFKEEGRKN